MSADAMHNHNFDYTRKNFRWILNGVIGMILTYSAQFSHRGLLVNGGPVIANEANSSPCNFTVNKGSSAWLHWNYTYIGDGNHSIGVVFKSLYKEQVIRICSSSPSKFEVLAKRIGHSGVLKLQPSTSPQFKGRVEVISSNSTLVLHDLQYSDSAWQFSSGVTVDINMGAGYVSHTYPLKPIIQLEVNGIPEFITELPLGFIVDENDRLEVKLVMNGNPKPSAEFKWPHLSYSSIPHSFSYSKDQFLHRATYKLDSVDASYCGKYLEVILRNSIGSSPTKRMQVFVRLKLEQSLNVTAERLPIGGCVQVKWNKIESADCAIKYEVTLKDSNGEDVEKKHGYNIKGMKICDILPHVLVTRAQLTTQFRRVSKTVTVNLSEEGMFPAGDKIFTSSAFSKTTHYPVRDKAAKTAFGKQEHQAATFLGLNPLSIILIVILVVSLLVIFMVALKVVRKKTSGKHEENLRADSQAKHDYTDLQQRSTDNEPVYADLLNEYEEIV